MEFQFLPNDDVRRIRSRIEHPIIDADGHQIEFVPLLEEIARDIGGRDVAERLANFRRGTLDNGLLPVPSFFAFPARNTLDRVTATVPRLLYGRLDEIGIDFGLVYPSGIGALVSLIPDDELRQVAARSCNIYSEELFREYRDRLEPVATIPMGTPQEAVDELRYVVEELGLKAIVMSGSIPRTVRQDGTAISWIDTLGHESLFDYDPVWATCVELGLVPTFHGHGNAWGTRVSSSNFVHNHIGHFATAQEGVCRSLVMGGVPRRFPTLRFGFLEGGITWAAQLACDLLSHFAKRNRENVLMFDPREQDPVLREQLFDEFAEGRLAHLAHRVEEEFVTAHKALGSTAGPGTIDDFAEALVFQPSDLTDEFRQQFYFGCEADDPMNTIAFSPRLLPDGIRLNAMLASDIGHFDVPDMREILPEAWEAVEHGQMSEEQFRDFSCGNVARMLTSGNANFFDGTVIDPARATQ
jgi:predicted TIM-barrel fold metal-dependent hydrolase